MKIFLKPSAVNRIQIHDEKVKVLKRLGEIRTLDQIKSYLLEVILHVCEQYRKNITPAYSKLVMETLEQIKRNCVIILTVICLFNI